MRRLPLLLVCLPLCALSACDRGPVARVPGRTVVLTERDYRISPQRLRVAPGRITFVLHNRGRLPHNWVLQRDGHGRGRIATLLPGESGRLTVRLSRGVYRMYCAVGHDEELGEYGTVSVR